MCEFIITALHIHNCVFNEKMKKKNLDTHTPFSILPYINSDHLVHKYKRNTRDQIYKKKSFVVLFKHNPEFFKAARSPWDWKPFQSCYLLSGIVPGYSLVNIYFLPSKLYGSSKSRFLAKNQL